MKEKLLRSAVFTVVFIISVIICSVVMNRDTADMTVQMSDASYPTVAAVVSDQEVNLMHGCSDELPERHMRGALTPLKRDRSLDIVVHTYGRKIDSISYEVRSLDGSRLVENNKVGSFTSGDGDITARIPVKDLIEDGKEYMLGIVLSFDGSGSARYYTRIIHDDSLRGEELLAFARDFSRKTFDKKAAQSLIPYLESDSTGDNSSYAKVNIHSSFEQITWGDLELSRPQEGLAEILELYGPTAQIGIRYYVSEVEGSERVFYDINEFFYLRYTENRIYLLSYERTMNQVFNPDNESSFANDKIIMGITDTDVTMMESEDGQTVAFVSNGALYAYRGADFRAVRVFSFFRYWDEDERNTYNSHSIHILNVDEAGNIEFIVCGYMNRGRHEGSTGISVYFYNSASNQIEELVYIPYGDASDMLESSVSKLAYSSGENRIYLYLGGCIYEIDLEALSASRLASSLSYGELVVSESNRMVSWKGENGRTVNICDLNTGKIREVTVDGALELRPLGFVGEDFVYGAVMEDMGLKEDVDIPEMAVQSLYIEDSSGNLLKSYAQEDILITSVNIKDDEINLGRIRLLENGRSYEAAQDDQIVNHIREKEDRNYVTTAVTAAKEQIVEISLSSTIKVPSVHVMNPEEVLFEGGRSLELDYQMEQEGLYYAYGQGRIAGIYEIASEAVSRADELAGVVLDDLSGYIWRKSTRSALKEISGADDVKYLASESTGSSHADAIDAFLRLKGIQPADTAEKLSEGSSSVQILKENMEGAEILNLRGCSLQQILYYIDMDEPVLSTGGGGESVLIVGYDSQNTLLFDPAAGSVYRKGMNDSAEWFAGRGNEFITCITR